MGKRKILINKVAWGYDFVGEYMGLFGSNLELQCDNCFRMLNIHYSYIIVVLRAKGLLAEEFKPICCYCDFIKKNYGKMKCEKGHNLNLASDPYNTTTLNIMCPICQKIYKTVKTEVNRCDDEQNRNIC